MLATAETRAEGSVRERQSVLAFCLAFAFAKRRPPRSVASPRLQPAANQSNHGGEQQWRVGRPSPHAGSRRKILTHRALPLHDHSDRTHPPDQPRQMHARRRNTGKATRDTHMTRHARAGRQVRALPHAGRQVRALPLQSRFLWPAPDAPSGRCAPHLLSSARLSGLTPLGPRLLCKNPQLDPQPWDPRPIPSPSDLNASVPPACPHEGGGVARRAS